MIDYELLPAVQAENSWFLLCFFWGAIWPYPLIQLSTNFLVPCSACIKKGAEDDTIKLQERKHKNRPVWHSPERSDRVCIYFWWRTSYAKLTLFGSIHEKRNIIAPKNYIWLPRASCNIALNGACGPLCMKTSDFDNEEKGSRMEWLLEFKDLRINRVG